MKKHRTIIVGNLIMCFFMCLFLFCACAKEQDADTIKLVFENNQYVTISQQTFEVKPGENLNVRLTPINGIEVISCDYDGDYELKSQADGSYILKLKNVCKSDIVELETSQNKIQITYYPNCEDSSLSPITINYSAFHLGINTAQKIFDRPGYSLIGWSTYAKIKGNDSVTGLGSRVYPSESCNEISLYAVWIPWESEDKFIYESQGDGIKITGLKDSAGFAEYFAIPDTIENKTVYSLGEDCLAGLDCKNLVLNYSIKTVESDALSNSLFDTVIVYDSIENISDYAFRDCNSLKTLWINAIEAPVFTRNYFATFADKYDYLRECINDKKIVLFSGSSTRFGYDSTEIEEAFCDYKVINMGVFAYANALPQLELIRQFMQEDDILVHTPEFDAAKRQFCTSDALEDDFFCMMEANYDMVRNLDIGDYTCTFSAFSKYLERRKGMDELTYEDSPVFYDEDGVESEVPVYNINGDYILYRQNSDTSDPIYGLEVSYSSTSFPSEVFIEPLNREYSLFLDEGVEVFFSYAPRNSLAVAEETTSETLADLDEYFGQQLIVPVLGTAQESLMDGIYFYGTDNHLSTEGVQIRTESFVRQLQEYLGR